MYNTTKRQVIGLKIERIELNDIKYDSFTSSRVEGMRHVKVLPWLSIAQAVEGSYEVALGNGALASTGEGGFFVAPSGVRQTIVHHVSPESGRMHCRWLFFNAVINGAEHFDARYDMPLILPDSVRPQMNALFHALFATDDVYERYITCYRALQLLASVSTAARQPTGHMLQAALDHIAANLDHEIRVADLAACAHTSPSNLYAAFKRQLGVSPLVYINNARLSLGAEYLRTTRDTVSEIALRVGITDAFYFSRLFRRAYAMSPRQYREEYQTRDH